MMKSQDVLLLFNIASLHAQQKNDLGNGIRVEFDIKSG